MKLSRFFSQPSVHPLDAIEYERRNCVIRNADGSVVFQMEDIEVPKSWSQLASDILISKYLRKAGLSDPPGRETSVRQVIGRVARTLRRAGEALGGYFDNPADAETFEMELTHVLAHQMGAFNSPVWFNLGLYHEYGIRGGQGNWFWNSETGKLQELDNNYEHPQCSACFIQSVDDDLMSIFQLVQNEARIFKYGSGTGTNFSSLRGRQERLSGGGTSSGLMSFLEVFDRAAGATKSGGTTRRAAKMVCLDAEHPEIRDFINWKRAEEKKARALIAEGYPADFNGDAYHTVSGQNSNNSVRLTDEFMKAVQNGGIWETRLRTTGEICETFPARDLMRDICESAWECADPGLQFDSTINAWHTCPNSGRIRASNPCSEYMFLDDSACNLASINLLSYVREDGSFDVPAYLHTIRLFILAQEILVDFSSYPTAKIARNSHLFRALGLGYANLGSLLMVNGLAYDSDAGRALAAALTAILTGHSYRVSAEIAATKGAFEEFQKNREPMLRVMNRHREAARQIPENLCPAPLREAALAEWDAAIQAGGRWGYRNAQTTVLAPTGTIGLLMDCDTTGIEPDFALVKFKKLAGGGYFKIVNQSVRRALEHLGYQPDQVREIIEHVTGTQRLAGAPFINPETLKAKGLTNADLERIEKALPGAFELEQAFSAFNVGEETLKRLEKQAGGTEKQALGFRLEAGGTEKQAGDRSLEAGGTETEKPTAYSLQPTAYSLQSTASKQPTASSFSLLRSLGFSAEEIAEAGRVICGAMTVEDAPHLRPEHVAVFDCASKSGPRGKRYIETMGHIRMMAATQPFISGAISKTVNMPGSATVGEIESVYRSSWEMGLKAVALYRDGCKSSQPLTASTKAGEEGKDAELPAEGQLELFPEIAEYGPKRRMLPKRRRGITVEGRVGGHKVFLRTGEYEDGKLGEVFIDMHKEGSAFRSMMMCFAIALSKGLQYGVPLREFVDTFTFTNFEPRGVCDHPNIKMASSVIDYVFRVLGLEYLGRTDLCQVKPEPAETPPAEHGERPPGLAERRKSPAANSSAALGQSAVQGHISPAASKAIPGKIASSDNGGHAGTPAGASLRRKTDVAPAAKAPAKGKAAAPTAKGAAKPAPRAAEGVRTAREAETPRAPREAETTGLSREAEGSSLERQLQEVMSDAPFCDICGHITVRNGSCYKCLNCGNSMGCS